MRLSIFSNTTSLFTQRALALNNQRLDSDLKIIGSGERIQRTADDSAGLSISEKLRADAKILKQGSRNGNDALGMVNIADASVSAIISIVTRLRDLAARASTGTISGDNRQAIKIEIDRSQGEIDRLSVATKFNDFGILDGSLSSSETNHIKAQVGLDSSTASQINLNKAMNIDRIDSETLGVSTIKVNTQSEAVNAVSTLSQKLKSLIQMRTRIGTLQKRLRHVINNIDTSVENMNRADSNYRDADIANRMAGMTRNQILVKASAAMIGQANIIPQRALDLL